jgi:hypothetical protein
MIKKRMKKAQMALSFGMIFSIILIVIFLAFAFYAISKFLLMSDSVKIGKFIKELQADIDNSWRSSQTSDEFDYVLPSGVEKICFIDYSSGPAGAGNGDIYNELEVLYSGSKNLFFYPVGSSEGINVPTIEHINLDEITASENPFCIDVNKGKLKLAIKKDFDEVLVRIER